MGRKSKLGRRGKKSSARIQPLHQPFDQPRYEIPKPPREEKIIFDWRAEFGVAGFELPPKELLAMCEEIYQARLRYLKYSEATCAPFLHSRTNDAIIAARAATDRSGQAPPHEKAGPKMLCKETAIPLIGG